MKTSAQRVRVGRALLPSSALILLTMLPVRLTAQVNATGASSLTVPQNDFPNAPSADVADSGDDSGPSANSAGPAVAFPRATPAYGKGFGFRDKLGFYLADTYLNPSVFTAPAFRAGIRMANPPGKYPAEWREGAAAFGRNYGDAFAERVTFHTARFVAGTVMHEDPRYQRSASRNVLARSFHALTFSFVDRSDSGRPMPAFSAFADAAAAGFVGNAYMPSGFNNATHAGQRATFNFAGFAAGNLFQEFAPQMPKPVRTFFQLIAR